MKNTSLCSLKTLELCFNTANENITFWGGNFTFCKGCIKNMLNSLKTSFENSDNSKCEFVSDTIHHSKKVFVSFSGGSGSLSKVRVRHSYQDIVEACCKGLWPYCPGLGGWMVNVAQVTYTYCMYKPVCARLYTLVLKLCFKTSETIFQVSWNKWQ